MQELVSNTNWHLRRKVICAGGCHQTDTTTVAAFIDRMPCCRRSSMDADLLPFRGAADGTEISAAEYLRMSTDHQQYSTENQHQAILEYARQHNMRVVRSYVDHGKSGLTFKGRPGLRALISDVTQGRADFEVVLVYDMSRWGRFQDADESTFYEQLCRRAGVQVLYCEDEIGNDKGPAGSLIRQVRRMSSGDFVRNLSVKTHAGLRTLAQMGVRQGGTPGFGLRRLLVGANRKPKEVLGFRQHKSIQTDRVILIPGPADEVSVVIGIYRWFVHSHWTERQIAEQLNARALSTDLGRPWRPATVRQVLTNEKYIGNNVWNRTSGRLKAPRKRNPTSEWVRCDGAFEPIVSAELFAEAQRVLARRQKRLDDTEMLGALQELLLRTGYLSGWVIDEQAGLPSSAAYAARFGGLLRAYSMVGYRPQHDYRYLIINEALRRLHPAVVNEIVEGIQSAGGWVERSEVADLMLVNGELSLSVVIARCKATPSGRRRWIIHLDRALMPDMTVIVRMNDDNVTPHDFFIFPSIDFSRDVRELKEENNFFLEAYRFDDLSLLYSLTARVACREAA